MTDHALYVTAAYGATAVVLAGLIGWVLHDLRARKRDLAELEAAGIRRRSDKGGNDGTGASRAGSGKTGKP